ncbi:MAG: M13 family metallopeptidase [Bacteroidetes bacterium]|nr:M13 family metallopeptidase [Bacteroidota bacterium]MBS1630052.1 M13 family metallopeptidase [Bacteroidota bacterium]
MIPKKLSCVLIAALAVSACHNASTGGAGTPPQGDILIADLDTSIAPGQDFFEYANGGWIKRNPIPADESSWGIGKLVNEELYTRKRAINEAASKKENRSAIEQQVANFWLTGMDSNGAEQKGIAPLQAGLKDIYAAQDRAALMTVAAKLHRMGVGVLFDEGVSQDAKNSNEMSYSLSQGGLGLPNRDYYFNQDARTLKIREAYPGYVSQILMLLGEKDSLKAKQRAQAILALETKLAGASRKLEALRDPWKNYHKMSMEALQHLAPAIDWPATITHIGLPKLDSVVVGQPEFYKALSQVVQSESIPILQDYFAFHFASSFAPYLSQAFVEAQWNFYARTLHGAKQMRPRWKRVLDAQESAIGEEVGQLFVKEYFPEKAKQRYTDMVEGIRNAFRARIEKLDWMSDSTKQKALHKLAVMKKKVGYPDHWKDFSKMQIGTSSYAENLMHAHEWWNDYQIAKLGKPVDRSEWDMTPQTYNAYYNPSNNEIVLPAGIFTVPGYRDEQLDDALVYGYAAASTIGHEITHGFDDEGRQFDADGNLKNWWSPADSAQFARRASVLVKQFNNMVVLDSLHLNGQAELGENLADLGGVLLGVDAFQQTEAYKSGKKISGLSPMQRFFLGYALGWLYQIRPEQLAAQVLTDVHAPAKYRVNGPFPNVPAFYQAFNVKPGDKMYLPDSARVHLW